MSCSAAPVGLVTTPNAEEAGMGLFRSSAKYLNQNGACDAQFEDLTVAAKSSSQP